MERLETNIPEKIDPSRDFIIEKLNLVTDDEIESKGLLKLKLNRIISDDNIERKVGISDSPEEISSYFEDIKVEKPDKVLRPKGDTTFFTTAGVQHIETILRERGTLEREKFIIIQPSIRSQFMDKIKDGVSTSFVNFSVESIRSNPTEFVDIFQKFISFLKNKFSVDVDKLRFLIEEGSAKWGEKQFDNIGITAYLNEVELGEAVYIKNYPVSKQEKISITDLGFSIERVYWATSQAKVYLQEFSEIYKQNSTMDTNRISMALDPLRSMVLIAGEGIKGSNHDHGYRLRQFSKRFTERCLEFNLSSLRDLVSKSLNHWRQWGYTPQINEEEIVKIIQIENNRNTNALFLKKLHDEEGVDLYININQPTDSFLEQIGFSVSEVILTKIKNKIL